MKRACIVVCLLTCMSMFSSSSCQDYYPTDGDGLEPGVSMFENSDVDADRTLIDFDYSESEPSQGDSSENAIPNIIIFGGEAAEGIGASTTPEEITKPPVVLEIPEEGPLPNFFDTTSLEIQQISQTVDILLSKVNKQQEQIFMLEKANVKLQAKVDFIEEQTKTNSLIFFNVPENKRETYSVTLKKVLHIINRLMKVNVSADDVSVALRAVTDEDGNSTRQKKRQSRPIIVKFTQFSTKMKVLSARRRLPARSNITVESDYSERVAKTRAQLLPYLQAARARGQYAFMLYDRIVIGGKKHTLQDLEANVRGQERQPDEQVETVDVDPEHQDHEDEDEE